MLAIALFSGGLDSCLAIKIVQSQGIEVIALNVDTGFESNLKKIEYLKKSAEELGVEFVSIDERTHFIEEILFSPKYGYGKNLNPCIDCHANMINVAYDYMKKVGAKFIVSGEVLGQRPMSQKLDGVKKIEKLVEQPEIVLRPLSAKLLPPTIPEIEGWIDREQLYDISGRERKIQIKLAKKFGFQILPDVVIKLDAKNAINEMKPLKQNQPDFGIIQQTRKASITLLQRRLKIGFARAARLMDELEER